MKNQAKKIKITQKLKKGFTLIEVLVSVVLIALLVSFLYSAVSILKSSNSSFFKKSDELKKRDFLFQTLHKDLFLSTSANTTTTQSKDFDILSLQTSNSFYGIINPFVTYIVAKDDKKLIRLESSKAISIPVSVEKIYEIYADELEKNVEVFKIYTKISPDANQSQSPNQINNVQIQYPIKEEAFLFLKSKNKEPLYFEVAK